MNIYFNFNKFSLFAIRAVIYIFAACFFKAYSQEVNSSMEYYSALDEYSHVALGYTNRHNTFSLRHMADKSTKARYVSNSKQVVGLGFHLFDVGFGLAIPIAKGDGVLRNFDFRANAVHRRWGLDFTLQKYRGYTAKELRQDVSMANVSLNGYYIFNFRKYSMPATVNFLEIQNRSAGSFLGHVLLARTRQKADSALLERPVTISPDTLGTLRGFRFTYAGILPGYGYTFSKNMFFVNMSLSVGPVHVWERYDMGGFGDKDFSFEWATVGRASVGYSSSKLFYGVSAYLSRLEVDYENMAFLNSSWQIKLFFGIRFLEKGFFRKSLSDLYTLKRRKGY